MSEGRERHLKKVKKGDHLSYIFAGTVESSVDTILIHSTPRQESQHHMKDDLDLLSR